MPRNKWPKRFYTPEQKAWCDEYERWTGFVPLMSHFEAGQSTFAACAQGSVRWYEMHTMDMHLKVSTMAVPPERAQAQQKGPTS
ncbi:MULTISPECIES: hypothetical protein [Delftia]|uniref:Uncharacterized protein n=1 Tax=Delftia lacustris TaxID=558537 RepID=A0A7T2YW85_9BURK|nr:MULTISPECIES: hypothetical protein [Delftia]EPD40889.1 hypothetical protein HMPREF9702_03458 [Delftia acidovorans CCUG 15835]QPS83323.1 hypothetical protein I6G47_09750 [Delftia lacustris]